MKGHRRKVFIVGVLLLFGGAIVNVAVAWGCALLVNPTEVEIPQLALKMTPSESVELARVDRFGYTWIDTTRAKSSRGTFRVHEYGPDPVELAPHWGNLQDLDSRFLQRNSQNHERSVLQQLGNIACGWPLRSFWCEIYRAVGEARWNDATGLRGGVDLGLEGWRGSQMWPRVLPMRIIGFGFAINTIFYAVLLWVLFLLPGIIKRTPRRRRGLCPACAYPTGTSEVCTECGAAIQVTRTIVVNTPPTP